MKIKQVELFSNDDITGLKHSVNNWLKKNHSLEIVNIESSLTNAYEGVWGLITITYLKEISQEEILNNK